DFGYNARWTADKLIASSPFRDDHAPSFFVNLSGEYAGTWADSGAIDDGERSGNFVRLIAHLRGITYEEACDYLIDKYGVLYALPTQSSELLRVPTPRVSTQDKDDSIPCFKADITQATSPYLLRRGITAEVQAEYGVGYNENHVGFTAIPFPRYANVLYRSTRSKYFFYERGGRPLSRMLYGIEQAQDVDEVVIVEGPIDALSWATAGYKALAIGGAYASKAQVDVIRRGNYRRIYLGGDSDAQGRALNDRHTEGLRGCSELREIEYGDKKDANDVLRHEGVDGLGGAIARACPVRFIQIDLPV